MLSKKTKYALKALMVLADEYGKGPVLISQISEKEKIPKKFLELILLELRNNGVLASKQGKGGGYLLLKSPESISLAQVVRLIDGPIAPTSCVSLHYYQKCDDCPDEEKCRLKKIMEKLRDANLEVLEGTSIADLVLAKKD